MPSIVASLIASSQVSCKPTWPASIYIKQEFNGLIAIVLLRSTSVAVTVRVPLINLLPVIVLGAVNVLLGLLTTVVLVLSDPTEPPQNYNKKLLRFILFHCNHGNSFHDHCLFRIFICIFASFYLYNVIHNVPQLQYSVLIIISLSIIKRRLKRLFANSSHARNKIAMKSPHRFGTPTIECPRGGDVRKCTSAKERAAKNQKTPVCHFGYTEKVYGLPCTVCTFFIVEVPS